MKAQPRTPDPATAPGHAPASHPAIEPRAAANDDELHGAKRDRPENPLWVINIAMAAFFIVTALVMMTS